MRKGILLRWTPLVLGAVLFCAAPVHAKEPYKVRLAYSSASATESALWFAKEGGSLAKYGINATLTRIRGSSTVVQAMLSGNIQISQIGGSAVVDADLNGADLITVATIVRHFVFILFSNPDIKSVKDLKGKAIGASRFGSISDFAGRFALQTYGLRPGKDVSVLQTGGPTASVAALKTGRIQAVALTAPATIQARKLGLRPLLDISKIKADFPFNGVVTSRGYLSGHRDVVLSFLKGYIAGAVHAMKDPAFAKKVLAKYFQSNDPDVLNESYNWIVKQNFSIPPYPAVQGFSTILQAIETRNPKAREAKPQDFIDSDLVNELVRSGFIKNLEQ